MYRYIKTKKNYFIANKQFKLYYLLHCILYIIYYTVINCCVRVNKLQFLVFYCYFNFIGTIKPI